MESRPYLSTYKDRHGKQRWRYRRKGVTVTLPGQPGEEQFEEAYSAALHGRPIRAEVIRHPSHAKPRTFRAAWRIVVTSADWRALRPSSRDQYIERAERFLEMPVAEGVTLTYGDVAIADFRRRHVKDLLGAMADRPHSASDLIVVLRKMITVALDYEWISHDPTHKLRFAPEIEGHRAWEDWEREKFEAHWPLGSTPRTIYALALYTGQRRADLVRIRWHDFDGDTLAVTQQKTGKRLRLPVLPYLRAALSAAPHQGATVLATPAGNQRTPTGLTSNFHDWTEAAGLKGATIHGLRKTLGKILAEEGATTRELMDALGHDAIAHAELYSRAADQERMARSAFDKAKERLRPRLKVVGGEPIGEPVGYPTRKPLK